MSEDHQAGESVTLEIDERFVEHDSSLPGYTVYAVDNSCMRSHYYYYVVKGDVALQGTVTFQIEKVSHSTAEVASDLPQPKGGFSKTYYTCTIA